MHTYRKKEQDRAQAYLSRGGYGKGPEKVDGTTPEMPGEQERPVARRVDTVNYDAPIATRLDKRARGGRIEKKTPNITINVQAGGGDKPPMLPPGLPPMAPPPGMPSAPPPPGLQRPMGVPPGLKRGGSVKMTAGAGTGGGRLEKAAKVRRK